MKNYERILFWLLFIGYGFGTHTRTGSWNDQSRVAAIQALVEEGSWAIDKSRDRATGDKYFFNNHFYSDKPPTLALWGTFCYGILHHIFGIQIFK